MDIFIIFLGLFLVLALIRIPIAFSIGIGAVVAIFYSGNKLGLVAPAAFSSLDNFAFLAIPAFIFAGNLMAQTGVSRALVEFSQQLFCRIKGSLGAVTVVSCALFGAVTGSALATVTAIGTTIIPEMERAGYNRKYATALISASGFLGILIPPSVPGIMYAISTGTSIAKVWLSTIFPAIILILAYLLLNYLIGTGNLPGTFKFSFTKLVETTPRFLVAMLMPIIIFVGIYGGIFTPTEAGAVCVIYGILAGWFIFRYLFKDTIEAKFWKLTSDVAVYSAAITIIIAFAGVAGKIITLSGAPREFTDFMLGFTDSKVHFLLMLNILLLLLGMVMEPNTTILLLGPVLAPAAQAYGIDVIHLGGIMVLNLGIGMITPPFAATLYVGCSIGGIRFDQIIRPILPFFLVAIPVLLITTFWSAMVMYLPNMF